MKEDEEPPEFERLIRNDKLYFVFLLDRSGSMADHRRMDKAKDALILFLRSLPAHCKFSIVSFGTDSDFLEVDDNNIIDYNEKNLHEAIQHIHQFSANMNGTDIATPLQMAISMSEFLEGENMKQRVFILTDGTVPNPQEVIDLCKDPSIVVSTIGIGDEIDRNML